MVGHMSPLISKPSTTIFWLSFDPSTLRFMQYSWKTPNSLSSNHSNPALQFLAFRTYVPCLRCKSGWYQSSSLSRWQPQKSGYFWFLLSEVLVFFCTFWPISIPTTPSPGILTSLKLLILSFWPPLSVTMVCLCLDHFPEFDHRNWTYHISGNPP